MSRPHPVLPLRMFWACLLPASLLLAGCAQPYKGIVKPVTALSQLSPELENLSSSAIDAYLKGDVRPVFPCSLAIAKLQTPRTWSGYASSEKAVLVVPGGDEAAAWRKLADPAPDAASPIDQVHFISGLLAQANPSLKGLRDAAAMVRAPLLLVYLQADTFDSGYNDAAMAYWTFIGLFVVPGNRVGHYTACQAVLVDTRSGMVVATADGEAKREENVLPGAVDIAEDRVEREAQAEAVKALQENVRQVLLELSRRSATSSPAAPAEGTHAEG